MEEVEKGWVQGRSLGCSFDIASRGGCQWTHTINSVTPRLFRQGTEWEKGNIRIHSRKGQRYCCSTCERTFAATTGTPFYRLRTATEVVTTAPHRRTDSWRLPVHRLRTRLLRLPPRSRNSTHSYSRMGLGFAHQNKFTSLRQHLPLKGSWQYRSSPSTVTPRGAYSLPQRPNQRLAALSS
jgi:hypothetical protein